MHAGNDQLALPGQGVPVNAAFCLLCVAGAFFVPFNHVAVLDGDQWSVIDAFHIDHLKLYKCEQEKNNLNKAGAHTHPSSYHLILQMEHEEGNESLLFFSWSQFLHFTQSGQFSLFAVVLAFNEAYWSYNMAFKCKWAIEPEKQPSVSVL